MCRVNKSVVLDDLCPLCGPNVSGYRETSAKLPESIAVCDVLFTQQQTIAAVFVGSTRAASFTGRGGKERDY